MAADNFKVKKGLEVGTGTTITSSGIKVTGIITATQLVGDGSGLTNVVGSGSGVVIKDEGSAVGTAGTINFAGTGVVAALSAGIATVTISSGGLDNVVEDTTPQLGGNLDLNSKFVTGSGGISVTGVVTATTFVGNGDFVDIDVDGQTELDDLNVAGVSTFNEGLFVPDNKKAEFGNTTSSPDLEIFHNTTGYNEIQGNNGNIRIRNYDTNASRKYLYLQSEHVQIRSHTNNHQMFSAYAGAQTELYHNNTLRLSTTDTGVSITGGLNVTGITTLGSSASGSVVLKHGGQQKLTTTGTGIEVPDLSVTGVGTIGRVDVNGLVFGTNATTFAAKFPDSAVANFGTDNDLKISHDNTHARITNGTGDIVVVGIISATNGVKGALTGNADTATTSTNVTVADESSDATCFPLFTTAATGNLPPKSGTNLTFNSSNGTLTATSFSGDGSALTGITASGSGVVVKHDGSTVGTAGTINFSTNLDVSPIHLGIVTVTASGGSGITTANVVTDSLVVSGISTFQNNITASGTSRFEIASMENGLLDGSIEHTGDTTTKIKFETSTIKLDTAGTTRLNINNSGVTVTGIVTAATRFVGSGVSLTSLNADELDSGEIPSGRFPATLPAVSGANLTSLTAGNISGTLT